MKSPRSITPHRCSPSPQGAKYIIITQDKSPTGVAEVCDVPLFDQAKPESPGPVTDKKNEGLERTKIGITKRG